MDKINFQDLPNTSTPINASNLNLLQSNIENALGNIQSGSNANGSWLKINDIVMCWYTYTFNVAVAAAWGELFSPTNDIQLPNFPIEFLEVPVVVKTLDNTGYQASLSNGNQNPTSVTNPGDIKLIRGTAATAQDYIIHVFAIGKWKE